MVKQLLAILCASGLVACQATEPPAETAPETALATGDEPQAFYYDPVDVNDTAPGEVLRTDDDGRILYASTNRRGELTAVSGRLIAPTKEWNGGILVVAPGTHGLADHCAPSRQEVRDFNEVLEHGTAVVTTDYEGLGTPGLHTYMDRLSQGHAVLDAAKAAQHLLGGPGEVVISGYSQGGGAAASAAELAHSYAPELDVRTVFVGAPPADLAALPEVLDGSPFFLFQAYGFAGLASSYDLDISGLLNERGQAIMQQAVQSCATEAGEFDSLTFKELSATNAEITDLSTQEPYASIVAEQRLGRSAPRMPVVITHGTEDTIIPFHLGQQLAHEWQELGADVEFVPLQGRNHITGYGPHTGVVVAGSLALMAEELF